MILCNITFCVSHQVEDRFRLWADSHLFDGKISGIDASATPVLSQVMLPDDLAEEAGEDISYAFQWFADSEEYVSRWFNDYFLIMYKELCPVGATQIPYFVTLLNVCRCL